MIVPGANITTGAGNGSGADGIWTAADFTGFTVTNAAKNISIGAGTNARSVALTANVAIPPAVGLPFSQVCFFYQDPKAVTTNATPTFQAEYKPTGSLRRDGCDVGQHELGLHLRVLGRRRPRCPLLR